MKPNIYVYILVMAGVTYLIRMLPLVLFKKEITSSFVKSFLYYVPYACLAAMTFPAILTATAGGILSGVVGLVVALIVAYKEKSIIRMCGGVYCRKNHGICDVNRENVQGKRHILQDIWKFC